MRNKKNIIWFDSYGIYPDNELNFVSKVKNKLLGQGNNQLQRLMHTSKNFMLEPLYSKTKYQQHGDNINNCGRYCAWFIMMINLGYDLKSMKEFIDNWSQKLEKPLDILIIDFTS
jgi:hypothetical protein